MNILISVIVPVFNAEKTIERCIDSILNQTVKEVEIILIDDNSTDKSYSIMNQYASAYSNQIHVIASDKPNNIGGPGYARNIGLKNANGKYISFVDSDDWIDSQLFANAYNAAESELADIVIFGVKNELNNCISSTIRYKYNYNVINNEFALEMLCRAYQNDCFISPMVTQKIYKKEFIDKYQLLFEEKSYFEDDLFTFKSLTHDCKLVCIPNVYYHYYQNPHSITHTFSKEYVNSMLETIKIIRNYISQNGINIKYHSYYSLIDRFISNLLNNLFISEQDVEIQKQYLIYIFDKLNKLLPLDEWIKYIDNRRIQRFFEPIR